ncbi:MAG: hypothetical protein ACTSR0_06035 [Candidatus Asgardarchaeia archaeon]
MLSNKKTNGIKPAEWRKDYVRDPLVIARYSLRCQKCGKQFPIDLKFKDARTKAWAESERRIPVKIEVPTKQFSKTRESDLLYQLVYNFDIEILIKEQWKTQIKSYVRRLYGAMNARNKEPIMCDTCYQIHKLQE